MIICPICRQLVKQEAHVNITAPWAKVVHIKCARIIHSPKRAS